MTKYLLLITLGPVQDFIKAARRTRDLWAGSQLLSELSRAAAVALKHPDYNADLIFPAQEDLKKHEVVNRIIAVLEGSLDPEAVGNAIEQAIRTRLDALVRETFTRISALQGDTLATAQAQVADLPEIYWVIVPFSGDTDYAAARENLEHVLAARKYTREFSQPIWSQPVPKSSIDGERESVIPEHAYDGAKAAQLLFQHYRAGRAERLSGVDLLKRWYRLSVDEADFPSTSHFAALPLLERWTNEQRNYGTAVKKYLDALTFLDARPETINQQRFKHISLFASEGVAYDASILFEERLADLGEAADLPDFRGALDEFYAAASRGRADPAERPDPYYALLHADGDSMGDTIDLLAKKERGIEAHQQFSKQLDMFANAVRVIVESPAHRGALVYSGGDDVLAFLPLHTVLDCAQALSNTFRELLKPPWQTEKTEGKSELPPKEKEEEVEKSITPTLSISVAICHHLEPLSDALDLARNAERVAKKVDGKNGLAITLSKRGGDDRTISGSWDSAFFDRLQRFVHAQRPSSTAVHDEALPDGAAYDLLSLEERLGAARHVLAAPLHSEALRILARKRGQHGETAIPTKTLNYVRAALGLPNDSATKQDDDRVPLEEPRFQRSVGQIADELIIAREIARAKGPLGTSKGATP